MAARRSGFRCSRPARSPWRGGCWEARSAPLCRGRSVCAPGRSRSALARRHLGEVVLDLGVASPGLPPALVAAREALDRRGRVLPVPDAEERLTVPEQVARAGMRVL